MTLKKYKSKRNFTKTPEPSDETSAADQNQPIFVVQKHFASHLHFDFRIETGKVLKSWAIPKGLEEDIYAKKLAIETEDHPIEYANFEGEIPKGQYGAGKVEIWDKGIFKNISSKDGKEISLNQAIKNGHINLDLKGTKLQGEYTLIFYQDKNGKKQWLFIKKKR